MIDAPVQVLLERGDRRGGGWWSPSEAVIAYPRPDGRMRSVKVPPALMVDALVRLNDVGPRPRPAPPVRIVANPGQLADALAARDPSRLRLDDPEQARAFAALIGGLREHWRVSVRWERAEHEVVGRSLEVLDTGAGYWLVVPGEQSVELMPATPTDVFRALCRVFPLASEVRI